jgi:hypothetical protein
MHKIFRVSLTTGLTGEAESASFRDFAAALHKVLANECDGSAHGVQSDRGFEIEVQVDALDRLQRLLDAYVSSARRRNVDIKVAVRDLPAPTLDAREIAVADHLLFQPTKLTRKYLLSLQDGVFLASNVCDSASAAPVFAELVAPIDQRNEQWARICERGAGQRLCRVFPSEDHFRK